MPCAHAPRGHLACHGLLSLLKRDLPEKVHMNVLVATFQPQRTDRVLDPNCFTSLCQTQQRLKLNKWSTRRRVTCAWLTRHAAPTLCPAAIAKEQEAGIPGAREPTRLRTSELFDLLEVELSYVNFVHRRKDVIDEELARPVRRISRNGACARFTCLFPSRFPKSLEGSTHGSYYT